MISTAGFSIRFNSPIVKRVLEELVRICDELKAQGHNEIRAAADKETFVVTNNVVSLSVHWRQPFVNASDDWGLQVREFNRRMLLPGEPYLHFMLDASELRLECYLPDLSQSREVVWAEESLKKHVRVHQSSSLANLCIVQFLKLVSRAEKGEVDLPSFPWRR